MNYLDGRAQHTIYGFAYTHTMTQLLNHTYKHTQEETQTHQLKVLPQSAVELHTSASKTKCNILFTRFRFVGPVVFEYSFLDWFYRVSGGL